MNIRPALLAAVCLPLVLVACAAPADGKKPVVATQADDGKTVALAPGDLLHVALSASGGTGYAWTLLKQEGDALKAEAAPQSREAGGQPLPGGSETSVHAFSAKGKGEATLSFGLIRPWEKDAKPAETFTLTLQVK